MKKLIAIILTLAFPVMAQQAPNVTLTGEPPNVANTQILHYTAGVLDYVCTALSTQNISQITVSSITNASPGVATATAHGFYWVSGTGSQQILVYISGATGGWATLNGLKILTPLSANTMSIKTVAGANFDTSGFGAYGAQSITVSTRAPKATASIWAVQPITADSSGNATIIAWAVKTSSQQTGLASLTGGTTGSGFPCTAPTAFE